MSTKATLSICAIMKYEAPYLLEWLEFHKIVGVQRFYLYENGDGSDVAKILQPYLDSGEVILHEWPISPGQTLAYEHCLRYYGQASEWIAFIDLDEFLFPTVNNDLKSTLQEFDKVAGIGVNWLMFGTSGHHASPIGLQIKNFTRRAKVDFPGNQHVKSVVKPDRVLCPFNPHLFKCKINEVIVTEEHLPLSSAMSDRVSVEKLRINHYFTRSREDMQQKLLRGRADGGEVRTWEFLESADRNEVEDLTIQRFLPQLRQAIASRSIAESGQTATVSEAEVACDSALLWSGHLDHPIVNRLIYGSTLFVSGWVIAKQAPVTAIQFKTEIGIIAEIPVNLSRPDVLEAYQLITQTALLGFQGTVCLKQIFNDLNETSVELQAVLADHSVAVYGRLKIIRNISNFTYCNREEVLMYERV